MGIDEVAVGVIVGVEVGASGVSVACGKAEAASVLIASSVCVTAKFTSEVGVARPGNPQADKSSVAGSRKMRIGRFDMHNSFVVRYVQIRVRLCFA
jgi:hypothetical protein